MNNPLIIDRPDLQPWQQKAMLGMLTAVFWFLWAVFWLPLITFFGWIFFGYQFQVHMLELRGYRGFVGTLTVYTIVIAVLGGSLVLWAAYNQMRFRGVDRRKASPPPTQAQLATLHHQTVADLSLWQTHAVVTVHHDAMGAIVRVEPNAAHAAPRTPDTATEPSAPPD